MALLIICNLYLLSPEVIFDNKSVNVFKSLDKKVELGTHLHTEFIEPKANFASNNTKHYQKDFEPHIEKQKLENLANLWITNNKDVVFVGLSEIPYLIKSSYD